VTGDTVVNDPTIPTLSESKIAVADTCYFFEKLTDKVCRECRYVYAHPVLFFSFHTNILTGRPKRLTQLIGTQTSNMNTL
jgi:hypothetical protein